MSERAAYRGASGPRPDRPWPQDRPCSQQTDCTARHASWATASSREREDRTTNGESAAQILGHSFPLPTLAERLAGALW